MHMVLFHQRQNIKDVVNYPGTKQSMLTAYFEANRLHENARGILYRDFPKYFTWQSNGKFWRWRKYENHSQIGRIVSAHPAESECYYLRVLLNHITGTTSYQRLRMVDSVIQPTFQEAVEKRGLIEEDTTLDDCLKKPHCTRCHHHYGGYLQQFWYSASQVIFLDCGRNI
jgi:ATP-dependent DNA helicase PIF1